MSDVQNVVPGGGEVPVAPQEPDDKTFAMLTGGVQFTSTKQPNEYRERDLCGFIQKPQTLRAYPNQRNFVDDAVDTLGRAFAEERGIAHKLFSFSQQSLVDMIAEINAHSRDGSFVEYLSLATTEAMARYPEEGFDGLSQTIVQLVREKMMFCCRDPHVAQVLRNIRIFASLLPDSYAVARDGILRDVNLAIAEWNAKNKLTSYKHLQILDAPPISKEMEPGVLVALCSRAREASIANVESLRARFCTMVQIAPNPDIKIAGIGGKPLECIINLLRNTQVEEGAVVEFARGTLDCNATNKVAVVSYAMYAAIQRLYELAQKSPDDRARDRDETPEKAAEYLGVIESLNSSVRNNYLPLVNQSVIDDLRQQINDMQNAVQQPIVPQLSSIQPHVIQHVVAPQLVFAQHVVAPQPTILPDPELVFMDQTLDSSSTSYNDSSTSYDSSLTSHDSLVSDDGAVSDPVTYRDDSDSGSTFIDSDSSSVSVPVIPRSLSTADLLGLDHAPTVSSSSSTSTADLSDDFEVSGPASPRSGSVATRHPGRGSHRGNRAQAERGYIRKFSHFMHKRWRGFKNFVLRKQRRDRNESARQRGGGFDSD